MAIRSRFKKLTPKEKLVVHRGPLDAANDAIVNGINSELEVTDPEPNEHAVDKDLGVDRSEIQEHHLQAALSSTQLAAEGTKERANYHIPTPESKQALSESQVNNLYRRGTFHDPHGYIKTSATLEESIRGPTYCLDEDDEDWLNKYNAEAKASKASGLGSGSGSGPATTSATTSKTKVEGNDGSKKGLITTDQFEMVMSVLELYVEQKQPFLHLDPSNLPEAEEVFTYFEPDAPPSTYADPILPPEPWDPQSTPSTAEWDPINPWANLDQLKPLVPAIYSWWCLRREDRQGKSIIPGLNFDETNEADPYVCFRRREVKLARKTRKSDALHVERLLRLTNELQAASTLAQLVARRERTKATLAKENKDRWTHASTLLQVKRTWKIAGPKEGIEDDELMFGAVATAKREDEARKKRKLDDGTSAAPPGPLGIRLTRRPKPSDDPSASSDQPTSSTTTKPQPPQGFSQAITKRVEAVQGFIERECTRRLERDRLFEDWTSEGLYPRPASLSERAFRQLHEPGDRVGRPASFRRRVGRGGRILLDRRLAQPTPVPSRLVDWPSVHSMSSSGQVEAYLAQLSHSTSDAGPTAAGAADGEGEAKDGSLSSPTSTSAEINSAPTLTGPFAFAPEVQPIQLSGTGAFAAPPLHESSTPRQRHDSHASASTSGSFHTADDSRTTAPTDPEPEPTSPVPLSSDEDTEMAEGKPSSSSPQNLCKRKAPLDSDTDDDDEWDLHTEAERYTRLFERWRYDADEGRWAGLGLMGTGGMEDDEQTVIDDFDPRFVRYRRHLLDAEDIKRLQPDPTYLAQAKLAIAPSLPPGMPVQQQRPNPVQRASISASGANGTAAQAHVQSSPLLSSSSPQTTPSSQPAQAVQPGNKVTSSPSFPPPTATDAVTRQATNGVQLTIQQQQQLAMQQRMQHLAAIRAQQQQSTSPNAPPASSPPASHTGAQASAQGGSTPHGTPGTPHPATPHQPTSYAGVPTGLPTGLPSGLPMGMNMGLGNGLQGLTPQQQMQLLAFQQQQQQQLQHQAQPKGAKPTSNKAEPPSSSGETTHPSPSSQRPASSPQTTGAGGATPVQRAPSNPMFNNLNMQYNFLGLPGGGGGGGAKNGQVLPPQAQAQQRPSPTSSAAQPQGATQAQNGAVQNPQVQQLLLQQQRLLAQAQAQQAQQAQQGQQPGNGPASQQQRNAQVQALLSNPQLAASLGRDPNMQAKLLALANQGRLPKLSLPSSLQGPPAAQGPHHPTPGSTPTTTTTTNNNNNVQLNPTLLMQMQMQLLAKQNQGASPQPQAAAAAAAVGSGVVGQPSPSSLGGQGTQQRSAPSPARTSANPAAAPVVNNFAGINFVNGVGTGVGMGQPNPLLGNNPALLHGRTTSSSPNLGFQQALMMFNTQSGPNAAHHGSPLQQQPVAQQPSPSMGASSPLGQHLRPGSSSSGGNGNGGTGSNGAGGGGAGGLNGTATGNSAWHQLQMQQLLQMQLAQQAQQQQQQQAPGQPLPSNQQQANLGSFGSS